MFKEYSLSLVSNLDILLPKVLNEIGVTLTLDLDIFFTTVIEDPSLKNDAGIVWV